VVERTKEIAAHYYLSEKDLLAVYIAAWFHDTGYLFTDPEHHEEKGVELMQAFITAHSADAALAENIAACIMATRAPVEHENLLQQIICDADTYHLGTSEFKSTNKKVWEEFNLRGKILSEHEWAVKTLNLLSHHRYYTKYCRDHLDEKKEKNMKKISKIAKEETAPVTNPGSFDIGKDKTGLMSKGIQTMLRMTSGNHLRLSDMADSKANILISVNAIIISVILSVLIRKLEEVPYLTVPAILFLLVAVVTIVISIIATRPRISGGTFSQQDITEKKTNLLFFGNFYNSTFEEYNMAMREMMMDPDYLYGSLIKDIYSLGAVLGRKYRLIRLAYNVFMIGIIVSVIAFALAYILFHPQATTPVNTGAGSPF
jgi:predicted metal-dependent HD superfamily phosphohydrolase